MLKNDVVTTYRLLGHKDETEIRLINPYKPRDVKSIFVYNEAEFVEVCRKFNGKYNIYAGINPRRNGGTKSEDVTSLNMIVFDIDPVRTVGLPSTDDELRKAKGVANNIYRYLKRDKRIKKTPYLAMSGNGFQIWLKVCVEIPNREFGTKLEGLIKGLQRHVAKDFEAEGVKIDNIGDLARVVKVIGTKSVKATSTDTRPNRNSKWVSTVESFQPNITWSMKLRDLALKYTPEVINGVNEPKEGLNKRKLLKIISSFTNKQKRLFDGDCRGYKSRSEAEFALVSALASKRLSPEEAWLVMDSSKMSKWRESHNAYKRLTISKAFGGRNGA